jgi:hypothetical protein
MGRRFAPLIVLLLLAALAGSWWWTGRRAAQAERQLGLDAARTLSESFAKARSLKVATLSGEVLATGSDPGFMGLLPSSQTVKYPYAVDYHVELGTLDRAAWRWDAATRTMTVRLPDVAPAKPNIDAARASYVGTTGPFMSRGAAQRLGTQVAGRASLRAAESARKPEHLDRARRSAREAVAGLVEAPLAAAGLGEVKVVVSFPWEGQGTGAPVPWDQSRALGEVYSKP